MTPILLSSPKESLEKVLLSSSLSKAGKRSMG
jgi:hypothetical protein